MKLTKYPWQVEAFEAVVFNEVAAADSVAVEVDEVVIAEEEVTADEVHEAAAVVVVEDEVVPTRFSSPTDIPEYSLQKAKTTCW
jgi:hypothetical protein